MLRALQPSKKMLELLLAVCCWSGKGLLPAQQALYNPLRNQ